LEVVVSDGNVQWRVSVVVLEVEVRASPEQRHYAVAVACTQIKEDIFIYL
jgi:hypothetical protein